jgi:hypothetical protein
MDSLSKWDVGSNVGTQTSVNYLILSDLLIQLNAQTEYMFPIQGIHKNLIEQKIELTNEFEYSPTLVSLYIGAHKERESFPFFENVQELKPKSSLFSTPGPTIPPSTLLPKPNFFFEQQPDFFQRKAYPKENRYEILLALTMPGVYHQIHL